MKVFLTLATVAALATTSSAWTLGAKTATIQFGFADSTKFKVVRIMKEVSCVGAPVCPTAAVGTAPWVSFYVAPATGPSAGVFNGVAINVMEPTREDSKEIIDVLTDSYKNGTTIQIANWNSSTLKGYQTFNAPGFFGIRELYRINAGDKVELQIQSD